MDKLIVPVRHFDEAAGDRLKRLRRVSVIQEIRRSISFPRVRVILLCVSSVQPCERSQPIEIQKQFADASDILSGATTGIAKSHSEASGGMFRETCNFIGGTKRGAPGRTQTSTTLLPPDFESGAYDSCRRDNCVGSQCNAL